MQVLVRLVADWNSSFKVCHKIVYLLVLVIVAACRSEEPAPILSNVIVNEQINLTNIQYNKLRQDNGHVYLKAGVRGIIVIRKSATQYVALERNCTYQPQNSCATVEMDASGFFLQDPCCTSQFDLFGQVVKGPATYPLRQYATATSGNFLYISN